jgi:hypothetical protein
MTKIEELIVEILATKKRLEMPDEWLEAELEMFLGMLEDDYGYSDDDDF